MKKTLLALCLVATSATAALATDDAIATRKALMDSNGAAAGISVGLMKGSIPYNPAVAKAALASFRATAEAYGDYFPDGSDMGDTKASPKIWEDRAGFDAAVAKFRADAEAAYAAAGRDGPADLAAFQAAVGPVLGNCKACHEAWQAN